MLKELADNIKRQLNKRVLNQEKFTELMLTAMFAGGHVLVEGVPGLAKTLWVRSLSQLVSIPYERVGETKYKTLSGTKIFVTDGVNQLEWVKVTLGEAINDAFFIVSILNPADCNTFATPSLHDRFIMKLPITYPGVAAEKQILQMHNAGERDFKFAPLAPVCDDSQIAEARWEAESVRVDESIFNYIVRLVETTRRIGAALYGASPRGSVALLQASKAYAAINGRDHVTIEDVRELALPTLRHRIILKPEALAENITPDQVIESILSQVK